MKQNLTALVLEHLQKEKPNYVSGEQLSSQLNISRTAVWKHIKKLQALGYDINANGKMGYQLTFMPKPIDIASLQHLHIQDEPISVHYFDQIGSTQIEAKRLAELGGRQGTLVLAEQQLQGKGRLGRVWHAPYGKGIWMSVVMRPDVPLQFAPQLTLLIAVVLCHTLRQHYQLNATIKWPNDVLINGKKCSGILLESAAEEQQLKYVVAGIGINVNLSLDDFPNELHPIATSLRIELDEVVERNLFLQHFYTVFDQLYTIYLQQGFSKIATMWENYADGFGLMKHIKQGKHDFYAKPIKLDESGALWVEHLDGTKQMVYAAEIGEVRE